MSEINVLFECCNRKQPVALLKSFQQTFVTSQKDPENLQAHNIGPHIYTNVCVIDELEVLVHLIQSRWYCIQDIVLDNNNTTDLSSDVISWRKFINEAFPAIIQSVQSTQCKYVQDLFKTLWPSIVQYKKLNETIILKIKGSRQKSCPYYQYFHTLLEIYYYMMTLYFICGSNIEEYLENIIENMLQLFKTSYKYESCHCLNHFWLVIQIITEKSNSSNSLFWRVFNKVLEKEDPLISLSFLRDLSNIHRYNLEFEDVGTKSERIKPNYDFLETKFRELLSQTSSNNCDSLIISFKVIEPLICDLWLKEGKIDILQIIWEFYSKRLNVSNKNCSSITALSFIETLDKVLFCPKDCTEDFEIFVGLLLFHLREYPMHWGKMKGRIYSQLGPNKVKDLSEIGIRHVMMLFLALSSVYFEEVEKKMLAFLDNLPKDKKCTVLVWNMYAAVVLRYVREGRSIEKVAPPILHMLQEASTNQKHFHLIKDLIQNLEAIVTHSSNMQLQQWLLFGSWLEKYQSKCYYGDLTLSLNLIVLLLEKCSGADSWSSWECFFKDIVYQNLKQLSAMPHPPAVIGKIAGTLALCYNNLTNEAFSFFNSDVISPAIASMFLEVILDSYPDNLILTREQEVMILQSWVKVCFLSLESQSDLTKNVIKLDIFPPTLKSYLKTENEPMQAFIEYLGNNSKQLTIQSSNDVLKLCDLAFGNLDKVLQQYLSNPNDENIVIKSYKYVSLIFLNCGNLIYNRNKPVTILTKLVQVLLLPMDFLVGKKSLHNFILNAVKRMWATFLNSFINMLNGGKDPYLERTLKDMVVKYLPYFPTSDSPIVNCLDSVKMAEIILDKIYLSYFKPPVKESDANVLKALKIVSDIASSTSSISIFKLVVNKTLHGLFEVVIFHQQRSSAIGVIKHITSSSFFSQVKSEFRQTVLAITEKNVALNTINYFQLMMCLAKFVPEDINSVLGDIRIHVGNAERLRGVGFDQSLRLHLEKLENSLQTSNC